jgi:lipopolysaccharide biosynthesis glycosyltransferase
LDSDLVVLDRLDELFAHPGWLAARRREHCDLADEFADPERVARQEGLTDRSAMMNSGVVLFDPKVWKAEQMLERSLEIGHAYGWDFFRNSDQGILDILAHRTGGFREFSVRFNFCRWPDMQNGRIVGTVSTQAGFRAPYVLRGWRRRLARLSGPRWIGAPTATIVHWNGPVKPWQFREKGENAKQFLLECYEQFTPKA